MVGRVLAAARLAVAFLISEFSPCRHQAAACAPLSRQVAARFRRIAGRTRQFASAPFAAASTSDGGRFRSFRRPQTAETGKESGAPRNPEAAMLRISAKTSALARDASHGQDQQYGARRCLSPRTPAIAPRGFARCKTSAITVRSAISAPPLFRKLHCGGRKQPNSLVRPSWSDTAAAGCGQVCRARPCCHRVAAHALRSAVVESENWHRAGATTPGGRDAVTPAKVLPALRRVGMREQPTLRFSLQVFAARLGVGFASGTFTQHTLSVWSGKNLPPKFFSCRQLPASGTLRHGI